MSEYTIKDKVAIIGVGETKYYKRGQAPVPEFRLACEAIMKAAEDAGIDVRDIDGISGYADDRNDASRLATALGLKHLGFAGMVWGGGGGGGSGAVVMRRLRSRPATPNTAWSFARWRKVSLAASARRR